MNYPIDISIFIASISIAFIEFDRLNEPNGFVYD